MVVTKESILSGDVDQLRTLLKVHFIEPGRNTEKNLDKNQRIAIASAIHTEKSISIDWSQITLSALVSEIEAQLFELPDLFKAELAFTVKVLEGYVKYSNLESQLNAHLQNIQTVLLAQAILDIGFWVKPHPLKLIVDFLYEEMTGWQDGFGRNSEELKKLFVESIESIVKTDLADTGSYVDHSVKLGEDYSKKIHNFNKLSSRLKDSETGVLKAKMSQFTIVDFINKITKGNLLPPQVSSFLVDHLANEIKLLMIKDGLESPSWLRWKKLLETVVQQYQKGAVDNSNEVGKKILHALPDELSQLVEDSKFDSEVFEDFINQIGFDFTQMALGKEIEGLDHCKQIELPSVLDGIDKKVSQSLIDKVKNIGEGQWFLYKVGDSAEVKRCKLLLSLPDFDQLLLSNFVGQKVLATSFEDFAYLLSSKSIRPIFQSSMTLRVVSLTLDALLKNFAELQAAMKSEAKKKALEAKQAQERKQQEAAEIERQQAAAKAKAEAEEIAARKKAEAEAEAEEKAAAEQAEMLAKIADDLKRQARLMIDTLSLGTWIEQLNPDTKEYSRIKLAVKFNATGRFVFVDADGATVADLNRDELVEMVLVKKVKLLESDAQFADRLAKVVKTIKST